MTVQTLSHLLPPEAVDAVPLTVARGDGIGPEIMDATLAVLEAAGARLAIEEIAIGERLYHAGYTSGLSPEAWASIRRTRLLLKGPITTPQGKGVKSLNVTLRKALGLFANVRPVRAYAPFVPTAHPDIDLVIVRENEEDLYAGIEHRQTQDVVQCLKLISRPGTERVIRYAFALAAATGRRKVTCITKDNIMKMTDGLFHRVFDEVAAEYPNIATEHMIIDIGAARLATRPERFDVVVCPNLYGDIVSDIAAEVAGSVGLAPSANIGEAAAMFEAVHGSAPDIAGQDLANPSGLLLAAVELLRHVGQGEVARRIADAWAATLEDGVHTADIAGPQTRQRVGTRAFAEAVIARLGSVPKRLPPARPAGARVPVPAASPRTPEPKTLVGIDVFVEWTGTPEALASQLRACPDAGLALKVITNRGVKVWPDGLPETFCTDHWRCRFEAPPGKPTNPMMLVHLLHGLVRAGVPVIKTEHLYAFDGAPGYSLAQGQ
ncbi:MAG: NADP-dependent isocitrate dehydrogenase [Elioraea sp.]|nr:NADP-dependent isocitrate dehydrogenase [Elioraea sp.]